MKKNKNFLFVKAQKAFKRGTGVVLCSVLMLFASCVKQKNCDCGETGKFIYLKEMYETTRDFCKSAKIKAHFINENGDVHCIVGTVPKHFQVQDTIRVVTCLQISCPPSRYYPQTPVYSLKCIERR